MRRFGKAAVLSAARAALLALFVASNHDLTISADEIDFAYNSETGIVTWKSGAPHLPVALLIIHAPKPLGFPKDSPRWEKVIYLTDHLECYAENPQDFSAMVLGHPVPHAEAEPIVVYPSGLTQHDFDSITYMTVDLYVGVPKPGGFVTMRIPTSHVVRTKMKVH